MVSVSAAARGAAAGATVLLAGALALLLMVRLAGVCVDGIVHSMPAGLRGGVNYHQMVIMVSTPKGNYFSGNQSRRFRRFPFPPENKSAPKNTANTASTANRPTPTPFAIL